MQSRKGISEIVAVVLLLLVTIAIIGISFSWLMSTSQSAAGQTENETNTQTSRMTASFRVESVSSNMIYIRNTGTAALSAESLSVFVNNNKLDASDYEMSDIESGKVGILTITNAEAGDLVDIYGASVHQTAIIR